MRDDHITLRQLRAFAALTETRSFTLAGERLGLTQSGISRAVGELEAAVEGPLFDRRSDGVVPNALGEALGSDIDAVLQAVRRLTERANARLRASPGVLRVATVTSVSARLLPAWIQRFRAFYPDVEVSLLEGAEDEIATFVRDGVADLALSGMGGEGLSATPLYEDAFFAAFALDHPFARRSAVSVRDLADEPFIMSTSGCEPLILDLFAAAGCTPRIAYRVRDTETLLEMAWQGVGVTLAPELCFRPYFDGLRKPLDPPAWRTVYALTQSHDDGGRVAAFLEMRPAKPGQGLAGYGLKVIGT